MLENELFKPAEKILNNIDEQTTEKAIKDSLMLLMSPFNEDIRKNAFFISLDSENYMFVGPENNSHNTQDMKITDKKIKLYEKMLASKMKLMYDYEISNDDNIINIYSNPIFFIKK